MSTRRLRVLHVLGGAAVGGAERQLLLLLRNRADDVDARLLLVRGGPLARQFAAVVPTDVVPKVGKADPICLARMVALLRHHQPDIVHTWGSTANLWGATAARVAGVPHLVVSDVGIDAWKGRVLRRADAALYGWADVVTGNASAVTDGAVRRGADRAKTRVIGNGVVLPDEVAPASEREPGLVVYLGRMHPDKGPDLLVDAVTEVADVAPSMRIVMAGPATQPLERRLLKQVRETIARRGLTGRIELPGVVSEPEQLLRRASVLALSSRTEGFPNVVLEAMANGTPVVATAVGGVPEVVADGVTGRLVAAGDMTAFGRALVETLADPATAESRARAARKVVEDEYSVEAVTARWSQLYAELAESDHLCPVA